MASRRRGVAIVERRGESLEVEQKLARACFIRSKVFPVMLDIALLLGA